ncbi:hypothetical protein MKX03_035497 [Papaver bracteatum]|nr:hypothetical protein MKX03_035497 [Papaver bracteatum]
MYCYCRVTNHTGVLFKKPALSYAKPKLHPTKDEHRDIFKYYTESLRTFWSFFTGKTWLEKSLSSLFN